VDYLSLCLICKDENDYLPEWLDYHILMGVDRFYIYDNESRISLHQSLKDYIERGWVVVMDFPGKAVQLYAYDHCLQTFGTHTFWLGFIDTDEFLVPKNTLDLKELLKEYEQYGGLAVSSLFFGSSGHQQRPAAGQIAAYTLRTHPTVSVNILVKCIVQPTRVMMPNSPHDFIFKENSWCVNESFLRVDFQRFPNHIEKIQLNHYFCRSVSELERKLNRGRGDAGNSWARSRFEVVNQLATYPDTTVLDNLTRYFEDVNPYLEPINLLKKMADQAHERRTPPLELSLPAEVTFRAEFVSWLAVNRQLVEAEERGNQEERKRLLFVKLKETPHKISLYVSLAQVFLELEDSASAWQILTQAWRIAPNSYMALFGMVYYFLKVENYTMAENTCHLMLEMGPYDLSVLGFMTEAMIGQGRWDEALKIGVPVVELAGSLSEEMPEDNAIYLVKKMADHLLEKKDYAGAVRLWETGIKCKPGDIKTLLELVRALLFKGDQTRARLLLTQARELDPQNSEVLRLFAQVRVAS